MIALTTLKVSKYIKSAALAVNDLKPYIWDPMPVERGATLHLADRRANPR